MTRFTVRAVSYSVHTKSGASNLHPKTMRVEYDIGGPAYVSEWICLEHEGGARKAAEAWWRERCHEPVPTTAEEAVRIARAGGLARPIAITVERNPGEDYDRIVECELGPNPKPGRILNDGIPF